MGLYKAASDLDLWTTELGLASSDLDLLLLGSDLGLTPDSWTKVNAAGFGVSMSGRDGLCM